MTIYREANWLATNLPLYIHPPFQEQWHYTLRQENMAETVDTGLETRNSTGRGQENAQVTSWVLHLTTVQ